MERSLPVIVLAVITAYTYAFFFFVPYVGFDFNPSNGEIIGVFEQTDPAFTLQNGDRVLAIDGHAWDSLRADARLEFFKGVKPGQTITLEIQRKDQHWDIAWIVPGLNRDELIDRIANLWFLAYFFWLAGTGTLLLVRPRDIRRGLFVAFYYLTAIWLSAGLVSHWQVWEGAIVYRSVIWLCLPVYLHLHWVFPKPLGRLPLGWIRAVYLVGVALAGAEWLQIFPRDSFYLGLFIALAGSLGLLVVHFIRQPLQRRTLGLVATAFTLTILPSIGISVAGMLSDIPAFGGGALLALPIIPLTYFYVIFQRQLGGLEIQANRILSIYLFLILLSSLVIFLATLAGRLDYPGASVSNPVIFAILATLITAAGYLPFKKFIEQNLLGISHSPERLVETYAERITTNLEMSSLLQLLRDEVLPSLLVRQFVLLYIQENGDLEAPLVIGVDPSQLPDKADIPALVERARQYQAGAPPSDPGQSGHWDRLTLSLEVNQHRVGFWLLGDRAPDDFYSQTELPTLQALANQTAIALTNIAQSAQLHAFYQTDIERFEEERTKLARDLHDDVLNQLIILRMYADQAAALPQFKQAYSELIEHTRQTISGLRPPMLDYGLQVALEEMIDEMTERPDCRERIEYAVEANDAIYDPFVAQHLYRIIQQACENALRHAQASLIRLSGSLSTGAIHLVVEDNGISFEVQDHYDITHLLTNGHYGLVGMMERAKLIGATIDIQSAPVSGTRILVDWTSPEAA